ncbi:DUF6504 family protein [Acetobacter oeni]|uniref:DNA-directed DNA polymerase n=1 Tax=Acetobacter oeni TaxID=304077 RepID=A0A511XQ96_9PROT|nr:DUF6504 family protein [Acetobacter oeni]NHO20737.1 DNA polymerase Y family protein [Acetobacter oeni]GBR09081.1 nucleotidyltransferase [Acetobacter oeni LMG 21952]GEN65141.1 nucleotidyltransferase [Acetobacter oeni]
MRRILSIWLPLWHTDLWRRRHPQETRGAGLVLHEHDGRRPVVMAADLIARQAGIRPGMALAHARSLIADLATFEGNRKEDEAALERLAAWCLWLCLLTSADPPDGVWCDTSGCAHLYGGEDAMLEVVRERLEALGYHIRLALADTPGAAHALARFGRKRDTLVPSRGTAAALDPLPVAALRLPTETCEGLIRLGFTRIGDLRRTARAPLTRRFGDLLMRRLDEALGVRPEPIRPVIPLEAIRAQRQMVEPIGTAEALAVVIAELVDEISEILRQRGQGARQLDLVCERVDGTLQPVRVGTASPVDQPAHLRRLLQERIAVIEPGFGIEVMTLTVSHHEARQTTGDQTVLERGQNGDGDLACLVDRLCNRVGASRVFCLTPRASQIPERAQAQSPVTQDAADPTSTFSFVRPIRLLDPPKPLRVEAEAESGAPQRFVWDGRTHRVRGADGPERIQGEWWLSDSEFHAARDYWIAETEHGERFWLYRQGDGTHSWTGDGAWFLHGLF